MNWLDGTNEVVEVSSKHELSDAKCNLLVFGYIHETEEKYQPVLIIADTICDLVRTFYDSTGRYLRYNKILAGTFKGVYPAFDTLRYTDVVWGKIDLSDLVMDNDRQQIFKKYEILQKINHPNIVNIDDVWYDKKTEHLNFIEQVYYRLKRNKSITLLEVKQIAKEILLALDYLHEKNIIHGNLTTDNIFICDDTTTNDIVVSSPLIYCDDLKTRASNYTYKFYAPEMFQEKFDEMVDVWSFGMVILQLVTSQIPFEEYTNRTFQSYQAIITGKKPLALELITNNSVQSFVKLCLHMNPKYRPTCKELLNHPFLLSRIGDHMECQTFIKENGNNSNKIYTGPVPKPNRPNLLKICLDITCSLFQSKSVRVEFKYNMTKDTPQSVAVEMVEALELNDGYINQIKTGITEAIKSGELVKLKLTDSN